VETITIETARDWIEALDTTREALLAEMEEVKAVRLVEGPESKCHRCMSPGSSIHWFAGQGQACGVCGLCGAAHSTFALAEIESQLPSAASIPIEFVNALVEAHARVIYGQGMAFLQRERRQAIRLRAREAHALRLTLDDEMVAYRQLMPAADWKEDEPENWPA